MPLCVDMQCTIWLHCSSMRGYPARWGIWESTGWRVFAEMALNFAFSLSGFRDRLRKQKWWEACSSTAFSTSIWCSACWMIEDGLVAKGHVTTHPIPSVSKKIYSLHQERFHHESDPYYATIVLDPRTKGSWSRQLHEDGNAGKDKIYTSSASTTIRRRVGVLR